jgi:hypothetical protein
MLVHCTKINQNRVKYRIQREAYFLVGTPVRASSTKLEPFNSQIIHTIDLMIPKSHSTARYGWISNEFGKLRFLIED